MRKYPSRSAIIEDDEEYEEMIKEDYARGTRQQHLQEQEQGQVLTANKEDKDVQQHGVLPDDKSQQHQEEEEDASDEDVGYQDHAYAHILSDDGEDNREEESRGVRDVPKACFTEDATTGPKHDASSTHATGHMPASASEPITSHFDAILECLDMLRDIEFNEGYTKQDVVDSIRPMLQNMLSTSMMHSFTTSMSMKGWVVQ